MLHSRNVEVDVPEEKSVSAIHSTSFSKISMRIGYLWLFCVSLFQREASEVRGSKRNGETANQNSEKLLTIFHIC